MSDFLRDLVLFFEALIMTIGYPGIFTLVFTESIFTPIPSEPLLPLAGALAVQGRFTFIGVWLTATIGAVGGALVLYGVGCWAGEPAVRGIVRRYGRYLGLSETRLDRGIEQFRHYGALLVFVGRFIPLGRPVVALVAGLSRLQLLTFVAITALSASIGNGFWIGVGYILGENWQVILTFVVGLGPFAWLLGGMALAGGGLFVLRSWSKHSSLRQEMMPKE